MSMEVTRKQAILLAVLGVILVVVIMVQLFIRPTLTSISENKATIEELNDQYDNLVMQSNSYDQNVNALAGWEESNSEKTSVYFPLYRTDQIERYLSFVINECDAEITNLTIGEVMQYYVDGEGTLVSENPDLVENADETEAASSEEDVASYTGIGIYTKDFSYTMEGDYSKIIKMLHFVDGLSFLGLTDFQVQSIEIPDSIKYPDGLPTDENGNVVGTEEDEGLEDYYSFTMTITVYMYQDPLEAAEEETEEATTDENGNVVVPAETTTEAAA